VQAGVLAAAPALLGLDSGDRQADAAGLVGRSLAHLTAEPDWLARLPQHAAVELYREWIWPMLPLSVAVAAAAGRRALRAEAAWFGAALLPYTALAVVVLGIFRETSEHGAYLLPLVWPAALLVQAAWPRRAWLPLLALSAALAWLQVAQHDNPGPGRAYAAGLRELSGSHRPFLLVGDYADLDALHVHLPRVRFAFVTEYVGIIPPEQTPALLHKVDELLAQRLADGDCVYLTEGAERFLADPQVGALRPAAPALLAHLRSRYQLERCAAAGFRGWRLRERD
jgi:hypothetical protein